MLRRSLVLAALLHLWLALLVGQRVGPAAETEGGWGRMTVVLLGSPTGQGDAAPAQDWRDDSPLGNAPSPRHGGRLREQPAPPDAGPGAQDLGRWKPVESPPAPAEELPPNEATQAVPTPPAPSPKTLSAPTVPRPQAEALRAPPLPSPAAALPPAPALAPPVERQLEAAPAPRTRLVEALDAQAAQTLSDAARERLTPAPSAAPTVPQTLQAAPAAPRSVRAESIALPSAPQPLSDSTLTAAPSAAPTAPQTLAPAPAVQRPRSTEAIAPLPSPSSRAPTAEAGLEPAPTSAPRTLQPADDVPSPRRAAPAESLSAPSLRELARPSLEPAPSQAPSAPQRLEATGAVRPQAERIERIEAPRTTPRGAEPRLDSVPSQLPESAPATPAAPAPKGDPLGTPADAAGTPSEGPRPSPGSPLAGARVGHDVATPPSASASSPLAPLNLSLPRQGALAGPRRAPGVFEVLSVPPLPKSKMEKAVEDAQREDCRKAHAEAGVLGALPLLADTARGKGCKW